MAKRTRRATTTVAQPMPQPMTNVLRRDLGRCRTTRGKLPVLRSELERGWRSAVELIHRDVEAVCQRSLYGICGALDARRGDVAL